MEITTQAQVSIDTIWVVLAFRGDGIRSVAAAAATIVSGPLLNGSSSGIWFLIRSLIDVRVSRVEEREGLDLDLGEHGIEAYPGLGQSGSQTRSFELV